MPSANKTGFLPIAAQQYGEPDTETSLRAPRKRPACTLHAYGNLVQRVGSPPLRSPPMPGALLSVVRPFARQLAQAARCTSMEIPPLRGLRKPHKSAITFSWRARGKLEKGLGRVGQGWAGPGPGPRGWPGWFTCHLYATACVSREAYFKLFVRFNFAPREQTETQCPPRLQ